jgi:hypothetical protein
MSADLPLLPQPQQVWNAIDIFLRCAYQNLSPPGPVQNRLDLLRGGGENDGFFQSSVFERDSQEPPKRLSLRLGNRFYPHMKLIIEQRPDGRGYFFRADTHDRHACPPASSREHLAFCELMEKNQTVAQTIEAAWGEGGVPTFKTFLKEDLARRQRSAPQP